MGATAKVAKAAPASAVNALVGGFNLLSTGILLLASTDALWAEGFEVFRPQLDDSFRSLHTASQKIKTSDANRG
ncbi:hypothetical protein [Microbispora sp. NBC_01389]|uniref:hypothetical protein n=1 Tax=Microbispora sp. NBC_01389 TaxID=2903584 RepID=UPI0032461822